MLNKSGITEQTAIYKLHVESKCLRSTTKGQKKERPIGTFQSQKSMI